MNDHTLFSADELTLLATWACISGPLPFERIVRIMRILKETGDGKGKKISPQEVDKKDEFEDKFLAIRGITEIFLQSVDKQGDRQKTKRRMK